MGSNSFKRFTTLAKLAFVGVILVKEGESLNIVDAEEITAVSAHEALVSSGTQFSMIDEGDHISIRNKYGLEMLTLPGTEANRDFYSDNLMSHQEYVLKGGKFADIRKAVVNGDTYFMETYDQTTGNRIALSEIENLEDEISSNKNMSLNELIDFVKLLSGEEFLETPSNVNDRLSYYDIITNEVVTGTPFTVLSSALKTAGFNEKQIDTIFEGTKYEDADRKEQRREQLEETDYEVGSEQFREVKYYDAVKVDGKLDIDNMVEMNSTEITQTVIDRYFSIVSGSKDEKEKLENFTLMISDYTKDTTEDDNKRKLAMLIGLFDSYEDGTIAKERQRFDRKVSKVFKNNRTGYEIKKGDKFDQFDEWIENKILDQIGTVDELQTKLDRLGNAHEEAMAYADECIANGKIQPGYYDYVVELKEKEINEACTGVTEESVEDSWDELDRLERDQRKMQDFKFLDAVIEDCEARYDRDRREEVAKLNGEWYQTDESKLEEKYNLVKEADEMIIMPGDKDEAPKMIAAAIEGLDFYEGKAEDIETSEALDEIITDKNYYAAGFKIDGEEIEANQDEDFEI